MNSVMALSEILIALTASALFEGIKFIVDKHVIAGHRRLPAKYRDMLRQSVRTVSVNLTDDQKIEGQKLNSLNVCGKLEETLCSPEINEQKFMQLLLDEKISQQTAERIYKEVEINFLKLLDEEGIRNEHVFRNIMLERGRQLGIKNEQLSEMVNKIFFEAQQNFTISKKIDRTTRKTLAVSQNIERSLAPLPEAIEQTRNEVKQINGMLKNLMQAGRCEKKTSNVEPREEIIAFLTGGSKSFSEIEERFVTSNLLKINVLASALANLELEGKISRDTEIVSGTLKMTYFLRDCEPSDENQRKGRVIFPAWINEAIIDAEGNGKQRHIIISVNNSKKPSECSASHYFYGDENFNWENLRAFDKNGVPLEIIPDLDTPSFKRFYVKFRESVKEGEHYEYYTEFDCLGCYKQIERNYYEFSIDDVVTLYQLLMTLPKGWNIEMLRGLKICRGKREDISNQFRVDKSQMCPKVEFVSYYPQVGAKFRIEYQLSNRARA